MDVNGYDVKQLMSLVRVAEAAERYEDMCKFIRKVVLYRVQSKEILSTEERNLLSVAYKNAVGIKRSSWRTLCQPQGDLAANRLDEYKKVLEKELDEVCNDVITLLEKIMKFSKKKGEGYLVEDEVFYLKLTADYYRYLAEYKTEPDYKDNAERYYKRASTAAEDMSETNPTRLGLALNYSVCCYEISKKPEDACEIAKKAFDAAIEKLDSLTDASYKDSTLIMQLLRDNLTLWTSEKQNLVELD